MQALTRMGAPTGTGTLVCAEALACTGASACTGARGASNQYIVKRKAKRKAGMPTKAYFTAGIPFDRIDPTSFFDTHTTVRARKTQTRIQKGSACWTSTVRARTRSAGSDPLDVGGLLRPSVLSPAALQPSCKRRSPNEIHVPNIHRARLCQANDPWQTLGRSLAGANYAVQRPQRVTARVGSGLIRVRAQVA
jgi:hypothetical protein